MFQLCTLFKFVVEEALVEIVELHFAFEFLCKIKCFSDDTSCLLLAWCFEKKA